MRDVFGPDPTGIAARWKQELYINEAREYRILNDLKKTRTESGEKMRGSKGLASFSSLAGAASAMEVTVKRGNITISLSIGNRRA